jgi:hypothetical protein
MSCTGFVAIDIRFVTVCTTGACPAFNGFWIAYKIMSDRHQSLSSDRYLFPFHFTCHSFSSFDDALNIGGNVGTIGNIKGPWLSSPLKPCHDLIPCKEAKLLFQIELDIRV